MSSLGPEAFSCTSDRSLDVPPSEQRTVSMHWCESPRLIDWGVRASGQSGQRPRTPLSTQLCYSLIFTARIFTRDKFGDSWIDSFNQQIFLEFSLHVRHGGRSWRCNGEQNWQRSCIHGAYILVIEAIPTNKTPRKWRSENTLVSSLQAPIFVSHGSPHRPHDPPDWIPCSVWHDQAPLCDWFFVPVVPSAEPSPPSYLDNSSSSLKSKLKSHFKKGFPIFFLIYSTLFPL